MDETIVGRVTHYSPKMQAASILVESAEIRIGDTIRVLGPKTDFTQTLTSLCVNDVSVDRVRAGSELATSIEHETEQGDLVFRIVPYTHVDGVSIGDEGAGP